MSISKVNVGLNGILFNRRGNSREFERASYDHGYCNFQRCSVCRDTRKGIMGVSFLGCLWYDFLGPLCDVCALKRVKFYVHGKMSHLIGFEMDEKGFRR